MIFQGEVTGYSGEDATIHVSRAASSYPEALVWEGQAVKVALLRRADIAMRKMGAWELAA